jgi:hypothetical protein
MKFWKFLIIWISQNLAIPFWMVGHVHLSVNVYKDLHEILLSMGMNIIVAIGFFMDYKQQRNDNRPKSDMH